MIKVNLGGCASFVKDEDYKEYVGKALEAFDVLANESGAGNDFLGWKRLPSETPEALIAECEAVRDNWKAKGEPGRCDRHRRFLPWSPLRHRGSVTQFRQAAQRSEGSS